MVPKQIDFLIITPLAEELSAVLKRLPVPQKIQSSPNDIRIYYSANLPIKFADRTTSQYSIIVLPLAKMGETEAATAASTAIQRWHPRYTLLVGIAGGLEKANVRLGDVIISEQIADYEMAKITDTGSIIRWQVYRVDQRLLIAAQNFLNGKWKKTTARRYDKKSPKVHFGPICTGNKVIADKSLVNQLQEIWAKLVGVEMEGSGVANAVSQSAQVSGFFMIRGVSDLADGKKESRYVKRWRPYACEIAAAYTIEFLKSGPVPATNDDPTSTKSDNSLQPISPPDDVLLNQLIQLPAALFERLVFQFDNNNTVPGPDAAQSKRAIELIKLARVQKDGVLRLAIATEKIAGVTG